MTTSHRLLYYGLLLTLGLVLAHLVAQRLHALLTVLP